jgi:hypothetical protein
MLHARRAAAASLALLLGATVWAGTAAAQARTGQKPPSKPPAKPATEARRPLPSRPAVLPLSRQPGRPGSFEVSASALLLGPGDAGTSTANLVGTGQGEGGSFTWFRAQGEYGSSAGVRATIGYNLTHTFAVEGGFGYSPSSIRFIVSDDRELTDGFTAPGQRLSEYFFDASLVAHLRRLAFARGRGRVFVSGGAGYLRQLHEGNALVETGQVYHGGGGVKYMLAPRARGWVRAFGLRIEARVNVRSGGFRFTDGATVSPAGSAGIVAAF